MRVVRIVTRLNRGGPLRQLQALVPALARLGVSGPVLVGEPASGEEDASADLAALGATIERVPGLQRGIHPARDRRAWRRILARLREERPDVVHTHTAKAGALGRTAARRAGVPAVVHTFHGHHFEAPFPRGLLARLAERRLARASSALVCLSPRQREDVVTRFRIAPPEKAVVIGPGIDVERLRASVDPVRVAEIRARYAPDGRPLVLWIGRFVRVKDADLLLEAVGRAAGKASPPPFRCVLAGDGPLRTCAEARARSLGVGAFVDFAGPTAEPASFVAACDAVVLSSRSEGTPVAILEAQVLAKPVVSTAVGGVPDLVRDGETGLLVPPRDVEALSAALVRVASDPALARRLGERAAAEAPARYGAERLAAETAALYRRLLSGGPAVPAPERGEAPARR